MLNQQKLETWLNTAASPHRENENSLCVHGMLLELTSNVFIVKINDFSLQLNSVIHKPYFNLSFSGSEHDVM